MLQLGLLVLLLGAPALESHWPAPPEREAWKEVADPCAAAREIVAQGPCLRPSDCGAFRSWQRLFGAPRTEPLDPQIAGPTGDRRSPPAAYLCLASATDRARPDRE